MTAAAVGFLYWPVKEPQSDTLSVIDTDRLVSMVRDESDKSDSESDDGQQENRPPLGSGTCSRAVSVKLLRVD